jgi:hypothetical protein
MKPHARKTAAGASALAAAALLFANAIAPQSGAAYGLSYVVGDMREPAPISGGTACPQRARLNLSAPATLNRQWSTALGANPMTILTQDQTAAGRLAEIESAISQSFAPWTGVAGSALTPASLGVLQRTPDQNACTADSVNTICFDEADPAFTTGVLAFTRVTIAYTVGEQVTAGSAPSTFVGEILDADVLVRPADATTTFATPAALAANPAAYDLQSVLTHEIGHMLGLGHSNVWRAVMFPFVPPSGQFLGSRPTPQVPDAPLAEDDRAAARVLYPDPADAVHVGSISGHILPANPLALAGEPAGTSGIFAAQVVAVDAATGAVVVAAFSGWSCADPGPPLFDGSYRIERLAVGPAQAYQIYAEPLDGAVTPAEALEETTLCRNAVTDPGWPAQFACTTPAPITNFSARYRASP